MKAFQLNSVQQIQTAQRRKKQRESIRSSPETGIKSGLNMHLVELEETVTGYSLANLGKWLFDDNLKKHSP